MKTKIIFTKKLANHLVKKGYKCINTEINTRKPELMVFVFESTPELEKEVYEYLKELKHQEERGGGAN